MAMANAKTPQPPKATPVRKVQEKCQECNHPRSFHGNGGCRAMACECGRWVKPT